MTSSTGLRISNPDNFFERSEGISDMRVKVDKNGNLTDVEGLVKDGWFAGGNCDACAPHYETIRLNCEISPEK